MIRLLYIVRDASGRILEIVYERDGEEQRIDAEEARIRRSRSPTCYLAATYRRAYDERRPLHLEAGRPRKEVVVRCSASRC